MQTISHYWVNKDERATLAQQHVEMVKTKYSGAIETSIRRAQIYTRKPEQEVKTSSFFTQTVPQVVVAQDSVTAVLNAARNHPNKKIVVLNFASYKNPGGAFLRGSRAQEESLCHESTLYPVLARFEEQYYVPNRQNLNRALYTDRALYTPEIIFMREDQSAIVDVLTCAAPNLRTAAKYNLVSAEENVKTLEKRIAFIFQILASQHVKIFIAGAFGCGVFGQDPAVVAHIFKKYAKEIPTDLEQIIYAVPQDRSMNLMHFQNCFEGLI